MTHILVLVEIIFRQDNVALTCTTYKYLLYVVRVPGVLVHPSFSALPSCCCFSQQASKFILDEFIIFQKSKNQSQM